MLRKVLFVCYCIQVLKIEKRENNHESKIRKSCQDSFNNMTLINQIKENPHGVASDIFSNF